MKLQTTAQVTLYSFGKGVCVVFFFLLQTTFYVLGVEGKEIRPTGMVVGGKGWVRNNNVNRFFFWKTRISKDKGLLVAYTCLGVRFSSNECVPHTVTRSNASIHKTGKRKHEEERKTNLFC